MDENGRNLYRIAKRQYNKVERPRRNSFIVELAAVTVARKRAAEDAARKVDEQRAAMEASKVASDVAEIDAQLAAATNEGLATSADLP